MYKIYTPKYIKYPQHTCWHVPTVHANMSPSLEGPEPAALGDAAPLPRHWPRPRVSYGKWLFQHTELEHTPSNLYQVVGRESFL